MNNGIIYWNSGTKLLVRLMVSLSTLEKHYNGPITIILNSDVPKEFVDIVSKYYEIRIINANPGHKEALIIKTAVNELTPYDTTCFIDCDTIILRPFNEMFEWAKQHQMVVTQFSDWSTRGGIIEKRIKEWHDKIPTEYINTAINYAKAINIGVFSFQKDANIFNEWFDIAKYGMDTMIPDEVSCQIMISRYPHYLAPQEFNSSCKYSKIDDNTRIIHYHGRKHASTEKTSAAVDKNGKTSAEYWIEQYKWCYENNWKEFKSIRDSWPDKYSKWVKL